MTGHWSDSWVFGLALIGTCIALHAIGLVLLTLCLTWVRRRLPPGSIRGWQGAWMAVLIVGAVGFALAALHAFEATLWAIAYLLLGAIESPADAILYSVDSMTTRGASGLVLTNQWRMMGALESAAGILLFGISTAFLFGMLQHVWPILLGDRAAAEAMAPLQGPPPAAPGARRRRHQ